MEGSDGDRGSAFNQPAEYPIDETILDSDDPLLRPPHLAPASLARWLVTVNRLPHSTELLKMLLGTDQSGVSATRPMAQTKENAYG
jgi:hypothetical protein